MIKTFCDRDGTLITSGGFSITWFNGKQTITSDLCVTCHDDLLTWFGNGKPTLEVVVITPADLQKAQGVVQTDISKP